jgi:Nucleotide modification associated domain 3
METLKHTLSESDEKSGETRTYQEIIGRNGKPLAQYLPSKIASRKVHYDPEFQTFSYGNKGIKGKYLLKLEHGDLLVFYAGLSPYKNNVHMKNFILLVISQ